MRALAALPLVCCYHNPGQVRDVRVDSSGMGQFAYIVNAAAEMANLKASVKVELIECGEPNAFWAPYTKTITLCKELVDEDVGMASFGLAHEFGHAVISVNRIPQVAREEDAADTFAALVLLRANKADYLLAAAEWFWAAGDGPTSDVHSLSSQRGYHLACLLYGHSPHRMDVLTKIPLERAFSCLAEYSAASAGWAAAIK